MLSGTSVKKKKKTNVSGRAQTRTWAAFIPDDAVTASSLRRCPPGADIARPHPCASLSHLSPLQQGGRCTIGTGRDRLQSCPQSFWSSFICHRMPVRGMEGGGRAIPPFANVGSGEPIVLKPLEIGVTFLRRVSTGIARWIYMLALARRPELGHQSNTCERHCRPPDLYVLVPAPIVVRVVRPTASPLRRK